MTDITSNVFLSSDRPFMQKYFILILLSIAGSLFTIMLLLSDGGLSVIHIFFTIVIIFLFALIVGSMGYRKYRKTGFLFGKNLKRVVYSLIAAIFIFTLTYGLKEDVGNGGENIVTMILNLPNYHYFRDELYDMGNNISSLAFYIMIALMLVTFTMIKGDSKSNN